jgi:phosphoribosyl-ATP pyrophosphohydrolase
MADFSETVARLEATLKARAGAAPESSYTAKLLAGGPERAAKKFGEEAVETVIAASSESRERLIAEAGDLLYHLLIVLRARGIKLDEIEAALAARTHMSGLEEKSARPRE